MRNELLQFSVDRSMLTSAAVATLSWVVVVTLAVAGVAMLSVHGDTGAVLLVGALVAAAPAAAISQRRNAR